MKFCNLSLSAKYDHDNRYCVSFTKDEKESDGTINDDLFSILLSHEEIKALIGLLKTILKIEDDTIAIALESIRYDINEIK
jgi:hypothetical protein